MKNGVSVVTLDDLITAALTGQPYNQRRLGLEAQRYARRLSKALAANLPDDLHDDVFGQAFVELFQAGPEALSRFGGKGLYRRAVLAAIRSVRASYAPPGQRTRATADGARARVAAEDIGAIPDRQALAEALVADDGVAALDLDRFASVAAERVIQTVEDVVDSERMLASAHPRVARALRLIHLHDLPVEFVAAEAMVSRFVLHREIKAFCTAWRAAA